jgi:purine-binding chemotaxis protein CheW
VSDAYVRVRIGGERYALPVEHVHEVLEPGELTPVPGAPSSLLGLRNLGGEILPAFDLARILQIEGDGGAGRLLVAERDGWRAAFAVDDVTDVGPLAGTLQASESPYLLSSGVIDEALVGVLDIGALHDALAGEGTP